MSDSLNSTPLREYSQGELQVEVRNKVAHVTLNRPQALNALSFGMIQGLSDLFTRWAHDDSVQCIVLKGAGEKAFCAGGDIRALRDSALSGGTLHHKFFIEEYELDYQLHRYVKPYISLLNGIVMGGGMGIAQGSGFRVVGPKTRMAMPETAIGLFPDVGGSYFLSRSPVGLYLGLTGITFRAADALFANLADRYLSEDGIAELLARLDRLLWTGDSGKDVARLIDTLATAPDTLATLAPMRDAIDHHFRLDRSVLDIVESLRRERRAEWQSWAEETAATLEKRSPTMLCVTHEQIRRGRDLSLADCFRMELGIVEACFAHGDVLEGIRAMVIDKDNKPAWRPDSLVAVDESIIAAFFSPPPLNETHPLAGLEARYG
ncbi:MAG: enoyl-CoA hydratase/isomerase family protein [Betaproteobacteria bacterium]|nr:enoyl-CoA hydratase/isomerase family protein [Betaproteobacteria bacterium]